jgi:hypothetical protein
MWLRAMLSMASPGADVAGTPYTFGKRMGGAAEAKNTALDPASRA